jgi:hypothetical protein
MKSALEQFAWRHVERKLAGAGLTPSQEELARLVSVVKQALPGEDRRAAATPPPVVAGEAQTLTRFALYFRRAEMTVELNANTGEAMSWFCSKLAEGNTPLTPPEALRVAEAAVQLPPGAILAHQGYEDMGGKPVFVAHWEHREDGVPVEHDYVRVLVSGHSGRVFAVQRCWHTVDLVPNQR